MMGSNFAQVSQKFKRGHTVFIGPEIAEQLAEQMAQTVAHRRTSPLLEVTVGARVSADTHRSYSSTCRLACT